MQGDGDKHYQQAAMVVQGVPYSEPGPIARPLGPLWLECYRVGLCASGDFGYLFMLRRAGCAAATSASAVTATTRQPTSSTASWIRSLRCVALLKARAATAHPGMQLRNHSDGTPAKRQLPARRAPKRALACHICKMCRACLQLTSGGDKCRWHHAR